MKIKKVKRVLAFTLILCLAMMIPASAFSIKEKLLEPFVETSLDWVKSIIEFITDAVLETFSSDLDTFYNGFPFVQVIRDSMAQIGFLIMFLVLIVSLVRQFMEPLGFKAESPIRLILNTLILAPAVLYGRDITDWIISLTKEPYEWLWGLDYSITGQLTLGDAIWTAVTKLLGSTVGTAGALLGIIALIVIGKNFLSFAAEIAEKYIVIGFLVICAPLAIAFLPSESTRGITGSWFKMLMGQAVMLVLDALIMRMFQSSMVMAAMLG